ncbi:MAG: electron transport complex subunit RsxG [Zoogloeaceae bacterium]|jgi:electron transport complex protein RnfG|nr:electron transport complex subunit RsxG [Zoogloeaceae bacterium]
MNTPREAPVAMETPAAEGAAVGSCVSAPAQAFRSAVRLFLFVALATALLSATYLWTRPRIEASLAAEKMKFIDEVLPSERYDNALLADTLTLSPTPELGQKTASVVYRARLRGEPAALVLEAIAPDGYAGNIRLVMGVTTAGEITGVRVVEHQETPGLGDYIDPKKDRNKASPWIAQFTGIVAPGVPDAEWKVKKEKGRFDQRAGATVSPRAVIEAVRKAARFAEKAGPRLFVKEETP